jgi:hypothetical protein
MNDSKNNKNSTDWTWVEVLPAPALVISADRVVLAINSAGEQEFGYTREELVGNLADFLVPAYAWPPAPGGISLNLAAETASGEVNPIDVYLGPATVDGEDAYLAMVEGEEYESGDSEEETHASVRELLSDIGRIVSSSLDIQSVCEQFSMAVMRSVPTERVAICALPAPADSSNLAINFEADALLDAFETHEPVLLTADELDEILSGDLAPLGWAANRTKAVVIVPLMAGSTRIGALILASSRADAFTFDDIDLHRTGCRNHIQPAATHRPTARIGRTPATR